MSMSSTPTLIDTLSAIQRQLIQYIYPLWLIFGIIGCVLNLIVFSRPKLRGTSCCIYFLAASMDHLLTLIIGVGPAIYALIYPELQTKSLAFCKIHGYLFQITLMLSRWFVAFACVDRYALSSDNVQLRQFANRRIARRSIVIIIILWLIICAHRLVFYQIQGNVCGILSDPGAAAFHSSYVIVGGGVVPATIMTVCALLIRRNLVLKHQKRMRLFMFEPKQHSVDHQVLALLFIQIICYLIFTIPQLTNLIFSAISNTIPNRSSERLAIERFVAFLAELMLFMFPVTSFYLYTLTSGTFRRELLAVLRTLALFRVICSHVRITPVKATALMEHHTGQQLTPGHVPKPIVVKHTKSVGVKENR